MSAGHDTDFYSWTQEQADSLRRAAGYRLNDPPGLDWLGLAEKVEALGNSLERELASRYRVRTRSGARTIENQRDDIAGLLEDKPSLRAKSKRAFARSYPRARKDAAEEAGLGLDALPSDCPFTLEPAECSSCWPEPHPGSE